MVIGGWAFLGFHGGSQVKRGAQLGGSGEKKFEKKEKRKRL